ncbi:MAG: hypothetical protein IKX14_04635, partial [Neisseriaceae bacterium]|nr:hypothetical protein [Neisseriaceae bacterium]
RNNAVWFCSETTIQMLSGCLKRLISVSDLSLTDITVASRDEITAWQAPCPKCLIFFNKRICSHLTMLTVFFNIKNSSEKR